MANILIIRFSALGDVAMTVPTIQSVVQQYPQHHFTMLSCDFCKPLFEFMPNNFSFIGIDLKLYKGLSGLDRLYSELSLGKYDMVADLHAALHSHYLDFRFLLSGKKVKRISKGRSGKRALVRKRKKHFVQQPTFFEYNHDVFSRLGLPANINFSSIYDGLSNIDYSTITDTIGKKQSGDHWIGIAPFAAHSGKIYPAKKMEEVVKILASSCNIKVFLFGEGSKEKKVLGEWCSKYPNITSVAGLLKIPNELKLMSLLDIMVSMDSTNMHLASLVGTKVVSVWGATHPYAGFMGWGQSIGNAVQLEMPCRPCSISGEKPCYKGNFPCLNEISPLMITAKIKKIIKE